MSTNHQDFQTFLRRGATIYPQPIAIALGRLARVRTAVETVDACLKAGEVLTRYLAAVCVASFAARDSGAGDKSALEPLKDNLSFGHFLTICQQVAKLDAEHPSKAYLAGFRSKGKGSHRVDPVVGTALASLLTLRNGLGHDLAGLVPARAMAIIERDRPMERLTEALQNLEGLLSCPLFVVDQQRIGDKRVWATRLWLMGESVDPEPTEIEVDSPGFEKIGVPYLALGDGYLRLDPVLAWSIVPSRERYGLLIIDGIKQAELRYQTLDPVEVERNGDSAEMLAKLLAGRGRPAELVTLSQGKKLAAMWRERRDSLEDAVRQLAGTLPWNEFDAATLSWYASRLAPGDPRPAASIIEERLLDGRTVFGPDEIGQLRLLFGTQSTVRRTLRRGMLDLRVPGEGDLRWKERIESDQNIVCSLRLAVEFVARHLGIGGGSLESLGATNGSADYLAMREALVNLFIHQDYAAASAAGQVELQAQRATFFNAGYSLVAADRLVEGGKSQSRNPLIARALRLIGFAELAGSGITTLLRAWRGEQRRPPRFENNRESNSFTVHLDWRQVVNAYDEYWKSRMGVKLTSEQAAALNLALEPSGVTALSVASGTGLSIEETTELLRYLVRQVLLKERDGVYFVADHLRDIATKRQA